MTSFYHWWLEISKVNFAYSWWWAPPPWSPPSKSPLQNSFKYHFQKRGNFSSTSAPKWLTLCAQGVIAFVRTLSRSDLFQVNVDSELTRKASVTEDRVPELNVAAVCLKAVVHLRREVLQWKPDPSNHWMVINHLKTWPCENLTLHIIEKIYCTPCEQVRLCSFQFSDVWEGCPEMVSWIKVLLKILKFMQTIMFKKEKFIHILLLPTFVS